jgi:hypothetical protein
MYDPIYDNIMAREVLFVQNLLGIAEIVEHKDSSSDLKEVSIKLFNELVK